jgi:LacI family transcriptional regulator
MPVRMKDIARDLEVSVITVSKALRNHADISSETKARVLQRAKELNYRPNLAARALVTGRTKMMGLIVPDLVHSFFAEVARGLSDVLRKSGYSVVISSSDESPELERQVIDQFIARGVDALLIASSQWTVESFHRLEEHSLPYILIDRNFTGLTANFVGVNDDAVGALATSHLIEAGCRTIAHITRARISTALARLEGYRRTLAQHNLSVGPEYVVNAEELDSVADQSGYEAAKKLLALNPRPDGIFCHNDLVASGAMRAIFEAGLRIPDDIALIGCCNVHYAPLLRVPLTSIDQRSDAIGEHAARLAMNLLDAKSPIAPESILLEPKLIVRDSTRRVLG